MLIDESARAKEAATLIKGALLGLGRVPNGSEEINALVMKVLPEDKWGDECNLSEEIFNEIMEEALSETISQLLRKE